MWSRHRKIRKGSAEPGANELGIGAEVEVRGAYGGGRGSAGLQSRKAAPER